MPYDDDDDDDDDDDENHSYKLLFRGGQTLTVLAVPVELFSELRESFTNPDKCWVEDTSDFFRFADVVSITDMGPAEAS